jgi:hypothetical protein
MVVIVGCVFWLRIFRAASHVFCSRLAICVGEIRLQLLLSFRFVDGISWADRL